MNSETNSETNTKPEPENKFGGFADKYNQEKAKEATQKLVSLYNQFENMVKNSGKTPDECFRYLDDKWRAHCLALKNNKKINFTPEFSGFKAFCKWKAEEKKKAS